MKAGRRDLMWIVLIAVAFIAGIAVSWERWGNPLVDCGREMNQPLRLANGEMLYSDVRHIYGPLSPYLNAALFKVFGPSLIILYFDGIITAAIIIALVYWLSRRLMSAPGSAAAALSVMWLCAFKQAGNYILPYSFSALHGCALGLVALALMVKFIQSDLRATGTRDREGQLAPYYLVGAGVFTGLAMLAKTEMGSAAMIMGVGASWFAGQLRLRRSLTLSALFAFPALALTLGVYWAIAARVGWHTLSHESYLILTNLPPELVYFNKRMIGFDRPLDSLMQITGAALKLALLGSFIASISLMLSRRKTVGATELARADAGQGSLAQLWALAVLSLLVFLSISLATRMQADRGPYLAMPVVLVVLLASGLLRHWRETREMGAASETTVVLIVTSAYALASLARVIFRVRSGGAYSSYLLPVSVILFTYGAAYAFSGMFRDPRAGRFARNIVLGLIFLWLLATAAVFGVRYRRDNNYPIATARGTIVAVPELGRSFAEAIDFINRETAPGEPVAVMPEGTSLNFLTGRPHPLREEIITPGFLDAQGEEQAIKRLMESDTRLVLITNRPTPEFGATVFGRDYCRRLMEWVEQNYEACAVFGGDERSDLEIGDKTFFIRAYRRK